MDIVLAFAYFGGISWWHKCVFDSRICKIKPGKLDMAAQIASCIAIHAPSVEH